MFFYTTHCVNDRWPPLPPRFYTIMTVKKCVNICRDKISHNSAKLWEENVKFTLWQFYHDEYGFPKAYCLKKLFMQPLIMVILGTESFISIWKDKKSWCLIFSPPSRAGDLVYTHLWKSDTSIIWTSQLAEESQAKNDKCQFPQHRTGAMGDLVHHCSALMLKEGIHTYIWHTRGAQLWHNVDSTSLTRWQKLWILTLTK